MCMRFTRCHCCVVCLCVFFAMQMNDLQHGFAIDMAMHICLNLIVPQMWKTRKCTYGFSIKLTFANSKQQAATHLMNAIITSVVMCVHAKRSIVNKVIWCDTAAPHTPSQFLVLWQCVSLSMRLHLVRFRKTNECTCMSTMLTACMRFRWNWCRSLSLLQTHSLPLSCVCAPERISVDESGRSSFWHGHKRCMHINAKRLRAICLHRSGNLFVNSVCDCGQAWKLNFVCQIGE